MLCNLRMIRSTVVLVGICLPYGTLVELSVAYIPSTYRIAGSGRQCYG